MNKWHILNITNYMTDKDYCKQISKLNKNKYPFQSWNEYYKKEKKIKLIKLVNNDEWKKIFEEDKFKNELKRLNKFFNKLFEENKGKSINIFPYPELLFSAFNCISPENIKCVIIGQDPYIKCDYNKKDKKSKNQEKQMVPQAMGLSFSVPKNMDAKSLNNIYDNLVKYDHMEEKPTTGNLYPWVKQGVFLLNMALTTEKGISNEHKNDWIKFTRRVIKYLNKKRNNLVFMLWGNNAISLNDIIDDKKHLIITSTHPSPMSFSVGTATQKAFKDVNHFGIANKYLKKHKKDTIKWDVL